MRGLNRTSTIFAAARLCALVLAGLAATAGVGRSASPETAPPTTVSDAAVGGAHDCATIAWPYVPASCAAGDGEVVRAARRVRLIPVDAGRAASR